MTPAKIKAEADMVPTKVIEWARVINLSSECDCQPCTVRRVVRHGIASGYGYDVKGAGEHEDANGNGGLRPQWCEKRGRLSGVEVWKSKQGVTDEGKGTNVKDVPSNLRNPAKKEAASVAIHPFRRDKRLYEEAIGEEDDAAPRSGVRRVGDGRERASSAVIKERRLETGSATKAGAPSVRNPFRKDKISYAVVTVEDAVPKAAVLCGRKVEEGVTTATATTRQAKKTAKAPSIKLEIKSECDKKTQVGFMNTRATNVTGLSKTNNDLIEENGANNLVSFLNSKRKNTEIGVRKQTKEAPNDGAKKDSNDDGARDQTELETNPSGQLPGQARRMEGNANDAEFAHTLSRGLKAYPMRRPGRPQRAKHPNQPQPANPKAAMTSIKVEEGNEIKKKPTVKTEPQWNITKDALRPKKHLFQNSTPQVTQGINKTQAGSSGKTAGPPAFATPAIPQDLKLLVLQYTPGRDPLEAPRGPRSRFTGPYANSVSSSSLSAAMNASPSSSYRVPQLATYKEAQLKRVGMPCANCIRTGVQTHHHGPTGYTLCDACHRLWTTDGRPFSWGGLGQNVVAQAFSANARQTETTPAMPSSKLVDYSDEEPYKSDHSDHSLNPHPGHTKTKPSQAPIVTPSKHTLASIKHPSAGNIAGSNFRPPSKKRDHGVTGPSHHNRPYKMPKKNDGILSVFGTVSKTETSEPGGIRESPKARSVGVAADVAADANNDGTQAHVTSDGKKGLEDTVQTFTMLCRKLFDLEKQKKEDQARVQRGEQALEEAKKKKIENQNEITGLVITMNYTEKTLARQRDSIANHIGGRHSEYQELIQSLVGHEAERQKNHDRFLELSKADMEVKDQETSEDRVERYRRDLEDTTRELKDVREKLKKLTEDEA